MLGLARSDLDLDALGDARRRRGEGAARPRCRGLGEWTADWFLARHLARPRAGRPATSALARRSAPFYVGGRALSIEVRGAGVRFDPFENLSAHYLLTGVRMGLV